MQNDKNYATLKKVQPKFSPGWDEINGKIISTWNLGDTILGGAIVDQAALHGVFKEIRNLGLTIISVNPQAKGE